MPAHEKSALTRRTRKSQYACQATPTWTGTISISACGYQAMGHQAQTLEHRHRHRAQTQTPEHRHRAQTHKQNPQTQIDTQAKIPNTYTQTKHPSTRMRSTPSNPARLEWPSPSTTSKYNIQVHRCEAPVTRRASHISHDEESHRLRVVANTAVKAAK